MNIVMATGEAAPFLKTGGLGDVLEALPSALCAAGAVSVFLPYYRAIKNNPAFPAEREAVFTMPLSWRNVYVGVYRLRGRESGPQFYFIDNNDYFDRENAYGYYDDGERFAFFSKAVLCAMRELGMEPTLIHCHDWQSALIPLFCKAEFSGVFPNVRTVLTIHNLEYQGWAQPDFLSYVLGLGEEWRDAVTLDGGVNFLKCGILLADAVTTVSESYAAEITEPLLGGNLAPLLSSVRGKLTGIVNGLNTVRYDPAADPALPVPFDAESFPEKKPLARAALRRELGLAQDDAAPILAIVSRLAGHKGIDLLCAQAEHILETLSVQLVVCGSGEAQYEEALRQLAARYPERCAVFIGFDSALASRIYGACDIYLMPSRSEPCGLSQLIAMRYGAVPVVHAVGGLRDTVTPCTRGGNGFPFAAYDEEAFFSAVQSACAFFRTDPEGWAALVQKNMKADYGWQKSAENYLRLYEALAEA